MRCPQTVVSHGEQTTTFPQEYLVVFRTPRVGAAGLIGGHVALSAGGDTVLWATYNSGVMVSTKQANFTAVTSLPSSAII